MAGGARLIGAVAVTQLIGWATTFNAPAVLARPMGAELGMSLPVAFAAASAFLVCMAGISPLLAGPLRRLGARPVLTAGSVLLALTLALLATAQGPLTYFLCWCLMGLAGGLALATTANALLVERMGLRARRGIGAAMMVSGLGGSVGLPVMLALEPELGWRGVLLVFAAVHLLVCAPLHWFAPGPRPAPAAAGGAPPAPPPDFEGSESARFLWMAVAVSFVGFITWGLAVALPEVLAALGLDLETAVLVTALVGVAQVAARGVDFMLAARVRALTIATWSAVAAVPTFAILGLAGGDTAGALLFALLFGGATGFLSIARATLPLELFDPAAYARHWTRLSLPMNLAFAAGPPTFTALIAYHGPQAPVIAAFLAACAALAAFLRLRRLARPALRACAIPASGATF